MDDLTAFIRARLDEDEHTAKQAAWAVADHTYAPADVDDEKTRITSQWMTRGVLGIHTRVTVHDEGWDPKVTDVVWREVGDHIVHNDPARILREVEAKRMLLRVHRNRMATLRMLALVWSDHPDYRQEWALTNG